MRCYHCDIMLGRKDSSMERKAELYDRIAYLVKISTDEPMYEKSVTAGKRRLEHEEIKQAVVGKQINKEAEFHEWINRRCKHGCSLCNDCIKDLKTKLGI